MPLYPPPGSGSGAPTTAKYIVQQLDATLSAEQALGDLATGILKSTTTTGVVSIATAGTDYESAGASGWSDTGTVVDLATSSDKVEVGAGAYRTSLSGYWKLDEPDGIRYDSHGANNLADNNTVTSSAGKISLAGQFTRANSEYLSIADNTSLSTGDVDFTIAAWVYLDSKTGTEMMIVAKDSDAANSRDYLLENFVSGDRFRFVVFDAASSTVIATANTLGAPALATWYFIVAWHDATGNTVNICVNNGAVDSVATAGLVPNDSASEFRIGARFYTGFNDHWDGRIDEVGFWKRVLTAAEITELYNAGAGYTYLGAAGTKLAIRGSTYVSGVMTGSYTPGTFSIPTGRYAIMSDNLTLVGTETSTLVGTATLRII